MTTITANTTYRQFILRVRCGGRVYRESVYTIDTETAWGHKHRVEHYYENEYGYKATVIGVKEVK